MLRFLLQNNILINLSFLLVLGVGTVSYLQMPREEDPSVNFNWIFVTTVLPGASASDVEERVTAPLEDAVARVADIKFITSSSRQDVSTIAIRFDELDATTFDKRINDLRRELQNKQDQLPDAAGRPELVEMTSANALPAAIVLVSGLADDALLHEQARVIEQELERLEAVERVNAYGYRKPELQVLFDPARLVGVGVTPGSLADTVRAYFRDLAAGSVRQGDQEWLIRLSGTDSNPDYLASLPIVSAGGEIPLRSVAELAHGREEAEALVSYDGAPAVMLAVHKKPGANVLELVDRINGYIGERNALRAGTGVTLTLLDDQTELTRNALRIMQSNAAIGLLLVLLVTWLFLGFKIAFFTSIGIPFVLAGLFWFLAATGQSVNVIVLLGVVISLGMLVDDAVVVVEAMYHHMQRGMESVQAAIAALREVAAPVTTSVLTTVAAFLPLMLLPGVIGQFMQTAPLVVTGALLISLIEAYWLLPGHVVMANIDLRRGTRAQRRRERTLRALRHRYTRLLVRVLRRPRLTLLVCAALFAAAIGTVLLGLVRVEFFAGDTIRLFYIDVEMPPSTSLAKTLQTTREVELAIQDRLRPDEVRAKAAYAGIQYTDTEPLRGDHYGQIMVSLMPQRADGRSVGQIVEALRPAVAAVPGPVNVAFLTRQKGPPTVKPINIKVRGENLDEIREAGRLLIDELRKMPAVRDISTDDNAGRMVLDVQLDPDAITRLGLSPTEVVRAVRLFADGQVVASMRDRGRRLDVRVRAGDAALDDIEAFLNNTVGLPDGGEVALRQLLKYQKVRAQGAILHYDLRRAISIRADLDKSRTDTVAANRQIERIWQRYQPRFPDVALDLTGELDDINETVDAMGVLFLFGVGLIYLILGTQFRSYLQPLLILATIPMAFTGVILGLLASGHPLSVYTLYGTVALAGIAVNAAIVMISAANQRLQAGCSVTHAMVYAARRRVVPILITSLTTMAGLLSLALGLGGQSLMWGPIATAIVWGLGVSTLLTLFLIPALYKLLVRAPARQEADLDLPTFGPVIDLDGHWLTAPLQRLMMRPETVKIRAEERGLADVAGLEDLYNEGIAALRQQDYENAVRCFEKAAAEKPASGLLNRLAAQALIMLMRRDGWDVGYEARAERHLRRAERILGDDDSGLQQLRRARVLPEPTEREIEISSN